MHGYLRHLANFAHVVQSGSITAAAARLDISPSVVSGSVKILEAHIGEPLLERRRSGVVTTGRGAAIAEDAQAVVDALARALRPKPDLALEGQVRISLPGEVADGWCDGALTEITDKAPDVRLQLFVEDQIQDHTRFARDLYLRIGPGQSYDKLRLMWKEKVETITVAAPGALDAAEDDWDRVPKISGRASTNSITTSDVRTRHHFARAGLGQET